MYNKAAMDNWRNFYF